MKPSAAAVTLFSITLAGCGPENFAPGSPLWDMRLSEEHKLAHFSKSCASYGFQVGTPEMAQCIQLEARSVRENANQAFLKVGSNMLQPTQSTTPTTTTCHKLGSTMLSCSSY